MDWKIFVSTFGGLIARFVPEAYVRVRFSVASGLGGKMSA